MISLQIAALKDETKDMKAVEKALVEAGFDVLFSSELLPSRVVLFALPRKASPTEAFEAFPWLNEEYGYSSSSNPVVMPFLTYHGKTEDPEEVWETGVGDFYDEVFSGEFKPYGWDLDNPKAIEEFHRVLEEYAG